jgi:hypothetical protein
LPQAGGLRYCTAAAFSSLKKYAAHFFNLAFGDTEEKEAAYAVAGVNSKKYLLNHFSLYKNIVIGKLYFNLNALHWPQKNSVKKFTE